MGKQIEIHGGSLTVCITVWSRSDALSISFMYTMRTMRGSLRLFYSNINFHVANGETGVYRGKHFCLIFAHTCKHSLRVLVKTTLMSRFKRVTHNLWFQHKLENET